MRWLVLLLLLPGCVEPEPEPVTANVLGSFIDQLACPYGNVTVQLPAFDLQDTTTELGGFMFRNLPSGRYEVQAYIPGIGLARENVTVQDKDAVLFLRLPRDPSPCEDPQSNTERTTEALDGFGEWLLPGQECVGCGWQSDMDHDVHAVMLSISWQGQASQLDFVLQQGDDAITWTGQNPTSRMVYVKPEPLQLQVFLPENQLPEPYLLVETQLSRDTHPIH